MAVGHVQSGRRRASVGITLLCGSMIAAAIGFTPVASVTASPDKMGTPGGDASPAATIPAVAARVDDAPTEVLTVHQIGGSTGDAGALAVAVDSQGRWRRLAYAERVEKHSNSDPLVLSTESTGLVLTALLPGRIDGDNPLAVALERRRQEPESFERLAKAIGETRDLRRPSPAVVAALADVLSKGPGPKTDSFADCPPAAGLCAQLGEHLSLVNRLDSWVVVELADRSAVCGVLPPADAGRALRTVLATRPGCSVGLTARAADLEPDAKGNPTQPWTEANLVPAVLTVLVGYLRPLSLMLSIPRPRLSIDGLAADDPLVAAARSWARRHAEGLPADLAMPGVSGGRGLELALASRLVEDGVLMFLVLGGRTPPPSDGATLSALLATLAACAGTSAPAWSGPARGPFPIAAAPEAPATSETTTTTTSPGPTVPPAPPSTTTAPTNGVDGNPPPTSIDTNPGSGDPQPPVPTTYLPTTAAPPTPVATTAATTTMSAPTTTRAPVVAAGLQASGFIPPAGGGTYELSVTVSNTGEASFPVDTAHLVLRKVGTTTELPSTAPSGSALVATTLSPGQKVSGRVAFVVPAQPSQFELLLILPGRSPLSVSL